MAAGNGNGNGNAASAEAKEMATQRWQDTVKKANVAARAEKPSGGANAPKTATPHNTVEKFNKTVLLSAMTWDTFSPPPSNSFKGKLVPRVVNRFSNRRKISIEIHRVTPLTTEADSKGKTATIHSYEECVIRVLDPVDKQKKKEVRLEGLNKIRLHEGSTETFDDSQDIDEGDDDDDDNDSTAESVKLLGKLGGLIADTGGKHFPGWRPRFCVPCQSITLEYQHKKSVHLLIRVQEVRQEREIIFDTLNDANKFCAKLKEERQKEVIRSKVRLQTSLGDLKLEPYEKIDLLIEVVSGWDLPIGDLTTSDPYVICMLGRREVHRTKHISGTLDPIWTVKTASLFIHSVESEELFIEEGMKFLVKDFDQFGGNETLGLVHVPPKSLYLANGERMEFKLQPVPGKTADEVPGFLAIRCRRASEHDKSFMEGDGGSMKAVAAPKMPKVSNNAIKSMITKTVKTENGIKKFKARPRPDPKRPDETEWMTKEQVLAEVKKPSRFWTDAGTGKLGRIYLEILSAEGLPNLDTGSWLGNLTDSFVSIVYEDTYVRTDTIDDCLNPVWLPWSQRAFILNIGHASSQIFLGVFDFDAGFDDNDLIGRVSIDITNLRPETEYNLSYNIYPSARISGRDIQGKINIRLRMEIPDERKLTLSALEPPLPTYVNVKKGKDFRVIRQTCMGKYDTDKYSLSTLKSYVDELREYQNLIMYIEDAVITLLLWRGHFTINVGGNKIMLPIHSFNAFIVSIVLVENPQFYPSFCFACVAWLLVAVMGWRRHNPDEWSRCQSFAEIFQKVLFGKSSTPPHNIKAFEGFDEAKTALEKWIKRIADTEEKAERDYVEAQKAEAERLKELEEIGEADADISTKVGGGISIDPIKAALHPVQLLLGVVCRLLRFVKHVVYWEEAYFSFWIATGSAFLSIVCLFVPWFFIMRWTARIVVWILFGPWMKLIDVFYVSKLKPETEADRIAREQREKRERRKATTQAVSEARQVRENAAKMRDMKRFMFGRFAMKVPILKQDRYSDRPLPESSATPYKQKALTLAELAMQEAGYNRNRMPGQTLVGDMIPNVETNVFTRAPTGKPTANPEKLARNTPGGGTKQKTESTGAAYTQIASLVVVAGVVTFFGVPLLASFTELIIGMVKNFDVVEAYDDGTLIERARSILARFVPTNFTLAEFVPTNSTLTEFVPTSAE